MGMYSEFMEAAYLEMLKSKKDLKPGKVSPMVGAVLVRDGKILEGASRCQTRDGHHAEQTLLDDLNQTTEFRESDILFVTLEPCVPESRSAKEIACSQRIVEARIKHVYIGMLDPNPLIYGKGVSYLLEHGVAVGYFDEDIAEKIRKENDDFIKFFGNQDASLYLNLEQTLMDDLSKEALNLYCDKSGISTEFGYGKFWDRMIDYDLLRIKGKAVEPTRDFLILFGRNPTSLCDGAQYELEVNYSRNNVIMNPTGIDYERVDSYRGPMILCYKTVLDWIDRYVMKTLRRGSGEAYRGTIVDESALREAVINSIVHRDYGENGNFNYFRIEDKSISIVNPAKLSQSEFSLIESFEMESSPKNPRIARIFTDLGLMERHHFGMKTLKKVSPSPIYTYKGGFLSIIFPLGNGNELEAARKAYGSEKLTSNDAALLNFIRFRGSASVTEITDAFEIPKRTANYRVKKLVDMGLLKTSNGEKTKGVRYSISR